jgi:solute carrier family 25 phosphate transporter 23/24/25/41
LRLQHAPCASIAATATAQLVLPAGAAASSPAPLAALAQEAQHTLILAAVAARSFLAAPRSRSLLSAQRRRCRRPAAKVAVAAAATRQQAATPARPQQHARAAQQLLAGGVAGAVSKTLVAPLERISTLLMTPIGGQSLCLGGAAAHAWRDGGLGGLYRGHAATLLKIVPASAIQFAVFNGLKERILASRAPLGPQQQQQQQQGEVQRLGQGSEMQAQQRQQRRQAQTTAVHNALPPKQQQRRQQPPELGNLERLAAGAAAGAASSLACYPLEALRTAMSVAGGVRGSLPQAARSVVAAHGVAALYRGFRASLLGDVLGNALGFTAYELGGRLYADLRGGAAPTPAARGAIGAASAAAVLTLTMPLEVARRRLQVQVRPPPPTSSSPCCAAAPALLHIRLRARGCEQTSVAAPGRGAQAATCCACTQTKSGS